MKKKNIVYLFEMDCRERTSTKTKNVTDNINVYRVSLSQQNGSPGERGWDADDHSDGDYQFCHVMILVDVLHARNRNSQYRESRPVATNDINHIRANVPLCTRSRAMCPAILCRTIINLSKYNFYGHGKVGVRWSVSRLSFLPPTK